MAGLSKRFLDNGYTLPKYMLYVGSRSVFDLSISSFHNYFDSGNFVFIIRNLFNTKQFIINECSKLKIRSFEIIQLESPTRGQAETVYNGIKESSLLPNDEVVIFNIDTIRKNYITPDFTTGCDGYLEVFKGSGSNWSYVKPKKVDSIEVVQTAEKVEISNLCSTGLYHFKKASYFIEAYENYCFKEKEYYVAPIYNYLIENSRVILYDLIKARNVIFSGVPSEYFELCHKYFCSNQSII